MEGPLPSFLPWSFVPIQAWMEPEVHWPVPPWAFQPPNAVWPWGSCKHIVCSHSPSPSPVLGNCCTPANDLMSELLAFSLL